MSEDMWHVEIEPGEVRVVTLEQMDDMYRLDIIQGTTKVWQEGMPRALPLSVVAGIDEGAEPEEEEIMEIEPEPLDSAPVIAINPPVSSAPPVSTYPSSGYPPPSSAVAVSAAPPATRSTITPPPSASVVVSQALPAPALPSPDFYSPQSLRPITMSGAPPQGIGTGTGGRIVMMLAVAAGLAMTLYRNDVLSVAAKSAGSESAYAEVESAFGQPGWGTPRSVEGLTALAAPVDAAAALSLPATTTSEQSATSTDTPETTEAAPADESADDKTKATSSDEKTVSPANRAPTRTVKPRKVQGAKKKGVKGFKGSEYDPMNASL